MARELLQHRFAAIDLIEESNDDNGVRPPSCSTPLLPLPTLPHERTTTTMARELLQHRFAAIDLIEESNDDNGVRPPSCSTPLLPSESTKIIYDGGRLTLPLDDGDENVNPTKKEFSDNSISRIDGPTVSNLLPSTPASVQPLPRPPHEAEVFASMFKTHYETLFQSSITLFHDMQTRLTRDRDTVVASLTHDQALREVHFETTLTGMRKTLDDTSMRGKYGKQILLRLATYHATKQAAHDRVWRNPQSIARCFVAWRAHVRARQFKALRARQAGVYRKQRIPGRPFVAWHRWVQTMKHERHVQALDLAHDDQVRAMKKQHEDELHHLRQQLVRAQADIEAYQLEQVRLEEDVRRVFLRGVSAMNLEALSLFRNNNAAAAPPRTPSLDDLDVETPRSNIPQPLYKQ
ncbi:Aste57867_14453 [Aphanomyces stellatus]|uniref:Centrosomal protein POC5 n=1 Tax=Aphanomyces stellatus TaxID=120398 RepID=A0A485L1S9_9STRA|nr:hypothetical protein As57867_014399 [Aphanomyces stellatus]VFT91275.1 Aste57867_14453 [Aphanomyces stellatus]